MRNETNIRQTAGSLMKIDDRQFIAAVIGCCGKTTFIEGLAREFRHKKVLISPTTKIKPMYSGDVVLCNTLADCISHIPKPGIQCLGIQTPGSHKLTALPPKILADLIMGYDLVLLEADGSRGLPCKGWVPTEPVIPCYCTHTVGVVTFLGLGKPANEKYVLRLPEFLSLTGLRKDESIHEQALMDMVTADNGMFKNAVGHCILLVNQIEDEFAAERADTWLHKIEQASPHRFTHLSYGSAKANSWRDIHK